MRSVDSEGDSIDDAIANALRELQVHRDRVEIEILADSTSGLFGIGRKKARVRATLRAPLWEGPTTQAPTRGDDVPRETPDRPAIDPKGAASSETFESRCISRLEELLSHLGMHCLVSARTGEDPGTVVLEAAGDSSGLLIGKRGQTLDAIEYLMNRMITRSEEGEASRIVVDVEGYRERRIEYLNALARRLADKARESARVVTLNPMSPRDRRIVHLALKDDPGVETRSEGEGFFRRLMITPAQKRPRNPRAGAQAR